MNRVLAPRRPIYALELTPLECKLILECIEQRFHESDRKNSATHIPADKKNRTAAFAMLAEIRDQLREGIALSGESS